MTDEELAEEYVDTILDKDDAELDKLLDEYLGDLKLNKKQAGAILGIIKGVGIGSYLAGLEAGRPKWHKVADGDLPKDDIKLAIIEIDDCGYLLCNYRNGFWCDANSGATCAEWITNNIIAWKEIVLPKPKEK